MCCGSSSHVWLLSRLHCFHVRLNLQRSGSTVCVAPARYVSLSLSLFVALSLSRGRYLYLASPLSYTLCDSRLCLLVSCLEMCLLPLCSYDNTSSLCSMCMYRFLILFGFVPASESLRQRWQLHYGVPALFLRWCRCLGFLIPSSECVVHLVALNIHECLLYLSDDRTWGPSMSHPRHGDYNEHLHISCFFCIALSPGV